MINNKIYRAPFFIILLLIVQSIITHAQKVLFNSMGRFKNFSTITVGDSILFRYDNVGSGVKVPRVMWVTDSTVFHESILEDVFAAVNFGDDIYLYSLSAKGRKRELSAIVLNRQTKNPHTLDSAINIGGYLIGSFIENKNLFFVLLGTEGLSIYEINKLNIVSQKTYVLPVSLANYVGPETPAEFYTSQSEV